jgi:epoxide hydrolase-like predicted phosphatase
MSKFKALIVDFGGVLTTPLQDSMVAFAESIGIDVQDLARVALRAYAGSEDTLVTSFETGRISEEEFTLEFAQRLAQETGVEVDPERLVQRIFGGLRLEEGMLDAVGRARGHGFKTALLSNSWGLDLYPTERFKDLFDVIVISGEVGMRKPDPEIFEHTVKELGVDASECVFVDDHPGHLKAALELGITTVLHREPAQTIAELETLLAVPLLS